MPERISLEEMLPEIQRAARTVAARWNLFVESDDLVQEIYMKFLESPGSVAKLADMEAGKRQYSLVRIGNQIASGHRDDYEQFAGQYQYSVDEVREQLSRGLLEDLPLRNDVVALDVKRVFEDLQPRYQVALTRRYLNQIVPSNGSADRKVLNRAVDSLTVRMNRQRSEDRTEYLRGGGRRITYSNSLASQLIDDDYNGGRDVD